MEASNERGNGYFKRENETFELRQLLSNKTLIPSQWVHSIKTDQYHKEICGAKLVADGCSQRSEIDYHETFSPTAKMTSIRRLMLISTQYSLMVHQVDMKSVYLNTPNEWELYMKQAKDENSNERLVYKLKKSLYGLKQSGQNWNNLLHTYLIEQNGCQSLSGVRVYTK